MQISTRLSPVTPPPLPHFPDDRGFQACLKGLRIACSSTQSKAVVLSHVLEIFRILPPDHLPFHVFTS